MLSSFSGKILRERILLYRFILLLFCFGVLGVAFIAAPSFIFQDITVYWKAERSWVEQSDPYAFFELKTLLGGDIGKYNDMPELAIWNPPVVFLTMLWTAPLSLSTAKSCYFVLLLSAVFFPLFFLLWSGAKGTVNRRRVVLFLLFFPYAGLFDSILWGGVGALNIFSIFATVFFLRNKSPFLGGLSLAVLPVKHHVLALWGVFLLLTLPREMKLRFANGALIGLIAALLLVELFQPGTMQNYLSQDKGMPWDCIAHTYTFASFFHTLGIEQKLSLGVATLLGFLLVVCGAIRFKGQKHADAESLRLSLLVLPLSAAFSPYSWINDYMILAPSAYALSRSPDGPTVGGLEWLLILLNISTFLVKLYGYPFHFDLLIKILLLAFAVIMYAGVIFKTRVRMC